MVARGLDALLLFRQESLYYLTGFDTFGYVFFQALYLGADGAMTLVTRSADLRQARHTSDIVDIRIWVDGPDAKPALLVRDLLAEHGHNRDRVGIEWDAYGLTARLGFQLASALDGFCITEDASGLVSRLRSIKSPAELAYIRYAATLADRAYDVAIDRTHAGAHEADILAQMQGSVLQGDGDYPGNPFIISSGEGALLCRYFSGRRRLDTRDQLTLEWAGTYRHYHACLMRTICVGEATARHRHLHEVALEALVETTSALKPGEAIGKAFDAHARVLDGAGLSAHRLNACGYSLGATFQPNWMDWPMLYHDNPEPATSGMVFFCHIIIMDSDAGIAMTLGQTVLIGDRSAEPITQSPLDLVVRDPL